MSKKTILNSKKAAETRLGESRMMKCGEIAFIVEYTNNLNITVEFKNSGELVKTTYQQFKNGEIKSRFTPSVFGIGYLGNEKTKDENGQTIKSYVVWTHMLRRCYSDECKKIHPTYKDCAVCKEWLNYSNFKKWYDNNYYEMDGERMDLDKDILVKGNKTYSPETCVFVPQDINTRFTKSDKARGKYPIGVTFNKNAKKFIARCNILINGKGQQKFLGYYNNIEEAFNAYKQFKENYIKQVADEYKDKIPSKLYKALYNYEVEITD